MKILVLALLAGCASGPNLYELEDQYFECTRDQAIGCDEIAAEIDRRYKVKERRAEREARRKELRCKGSAICMEGDELDEFIRNNGGQIPFPQHRR